MGTFTTRDGCEMYYENWGTGLPIVFTGGDEVAVTSVDTAADSRQGRLISAVLARSYRSKPSVSQTGQGFETARPPWRARRLTDTDKDQLNADLLTFLQA
jgi:hypothetical protein